MLQMKNTENKKPKFFDSLEADSPEKKTKDLLGGLLGREVENDLINSIFNQSNNSRGGFTESKKSNGNTGVSPSQLRDDRTMLKHLKTMTSTSQRGMTTDDRSSISFPKAIDSIALNKKKNRNKEGDMIQPYSMRVDKNFKRSTTDNPQLNNDSKMTQDRLIKTKKVPNSKEYLINLIREETPTPENNKIELRALEVQVEKKSSPQLELPPSFIKEQENESHTSDHEVDPENRAFHQRATIRQKSNSEMGDTPKFQFAPTSRFANFTREEEPHSSKNSQSDATPLKSPTKYSLPKFHKSQTLLNHRVSASLRKQSSLTSQPGVLEGRPSGQKSSRSISDSSSSSRSRSPIQSRVISVAGGGVSPKPILINNTNSKLNYLRSHTLHDLAVSVASYKRSSKTPPKKSRRGQGKNVSFSGNLEVFLVESYKLHNKLSRVDNKLNQKCCWGCTLH